MDLCLSLSDRKIFYFYILITLNITRLRIWKIIRIHELKLNHLIFRIKLKFNFMINLSGSDGIGPLLVPYSLVNHEISCQ